LEHKGNKGTAMNGNLIEMIAETIKEQNEQKDKSSIPKAEKQRFHLAK
jgi:hypothetical protein